ncbi:glycosyltransferase [Croceiramulus getboli]|nr:glycosyl transferase family 1 [Flavobacteriaceae bacterium YJPT1-3]
MVPNPKPSGLRALIVTYYWPPAGGPGVQRWLKFVKYLPEFGIKPIVVIPENASYPLLDPTIGSDLPDDLEMLLVPIREPNQWLKRWGASSARSISSGMIPPEQKQSLRQRFLLFVRGNLFIPDARKYWVGPTTKRIRNYLATHPVDLLITTGPPHSVHRIGQHIKKKHPQLPWVADFRDPWTAIGYHDKLKLTSWAQRKHQQLEQEILDQADNLLVTAPGLKWSFEQQTETPITVITNGYDEPNTATHRFSDSFTLAHIGSLLSDRNPEILWEALAELKKENEDFSDNLKLVLAGRVSETVVESIKERGLEPQLDFRGYVSHAEAIKLQEEAAMLLLIEIDRPEMEVIIPGKLFEYLRARRPILALGPPRADFRKILEETQAGTFFTYDQKAPLKAQLQEDYNRFKEGMLSVPEMNIAVYSRRALTGKLANLLHQLKAH